MGIKLKGWGGVLVVTGAGLLALPWIDGYMFKQQYLNYVAAAAPANGLKVSIEEYHQGWLHSDAKMVVQYVPQANELPNPMTSMLPEKFIMEQKITHGPLVRNPLTQRWTIAMAAVNTTFHLPAEIERMLLGSQASEGLVKVSMVAMFGGKFVNQFTMPVISKTIPQVGSFTWQGLNGTSSVLMSGSTMAHAEANVTIGALTAQSPQGSLTTKDMTIKYDLKPVASGLWSGPFHLEVPQITATSPAGNFSLSNLQFINSLTVTGDQCNISMQAMLGQMDWPGHAISQSNLNIAVNHINAQALMNLVKATQMQMNYLTEQQYQQYYGAYLMPLFTPATVASYSSTINSSYGHLISDGQVQWPAGVKQPHDVMTNANAKLNLRVSMSLVKKIIEETNAKPQQAQAGASGQPSEQQLAKEIDALAVAGKMDVSTSEKLKDLIHTHLAVANFNLNIDEYVQRKELTDEMGAQLKAQYAMLMDATKHSVNSPAVTAQSSPAADQMKQQLDTLVQQGYLTVDKDDYVTVLTYEQGVFKANGHAVMNGAGAA